MALRPVSSLAIKLGRFQVCHSRGCSWSMLGRCCIWLWDAAMPMNVINQASCKHLHNGNTRPKPLFIYNTYVCMVIEERLLGWALAIAPMNDVCSPDCLPVRCHLKSHHGSYSMLNGTGSETISIAKIQAGHQSWCIACLMTLHLNGVGMLNFGLHCRWMLAVVVWFAVDKHGAKWLLSCGFLKIIRQFNCLISN